MVMFPIQPVLRAICGITKAEPYTESTWTLKASLLAVSQIVLNFAKAQRLLASRISDVGLSSGLGAGAFPSSSNSGVVCRENGVDCSLVSERCSTIYPDACLLIWPRPARVPLHGFHFWPKPWYCWMSQISWCPCPDGVSGRTAPWTKTESTRTTKICRALGVSDYGHYFSSTLQPIIPSGQLTNPSTHPLIPSTHPINPSTIGPRPRYHSMYVCFYVGPGPKLQGSLSLVGPSNLHQHLCWFWYWFGVVLGSILGPSRGHVGVILAPFSAQVGPGTAFELF